MSHGDKVDQAPSGFNVTASSDGCPVAAMEDSSRRIYALQFHPEVNHTEHGREIIKNFLRLANVKSRVVAVIYRRRINCPHPRRSGK